MGLQPYAPRGARLGAFLIDSVLWFAAKAAGSVAGLALGVAAAERAPASLDTSQFMNQGLNFGWVFWGVAAWFINYGVLQGMTGATLGKHLMRIRVVGVDGAPITVLRSLARTAAYPLSWIPLGLGFASIFWTKKFQGLHDKIASTVVIRRDARYPVPQAVAVPARMITSVPRVPSESTDDDQDLPRAA